MLFGSRKSKISVDSDRIEAFLSRGIENIFPSKDFLKKAMLKGEVLTIYLGIDPTGPTLHLGHAIILLKLAEFQNLGHKVVLLIGDFTATIGDPTDKLAARKKLTRAEVLQNAKLYKKQAEKIIAFQGPNATVIKYNSDWLSPLKLDDVLELASHITVGELIKRDMFQKRMEDGKPIYLHEFMYPLLQGFDSVAIDTDIEIGGNDQTFNMLAGRALMKDLKSKEKAVIAMKLLVDPTGKKMGKTEGNMVSFDDSPSDIFGKVMSWPDEMIIPGFELCTAVPANKIDEIKEVLNGGANPKNLKMDLAFEITSLLSTESDAATARDNFNDVFSSGGIPEEIKKTEVNSGSILVDVLLDAEQIKSKTEGRRLMEEGGIRNAETNEKISDYFCKVNESLTVKIGKKRFLKIIVK